MYKTVVGTVDIIMSKTNDAGASLVPHWLRMRAPNAGGLGLIPGQGTRARMLQLKKKILYAATKTQRSQINK